jgi:F-type H+-transporting ATPase subunit gamma
MGSVEGFHSPLLETHPKARKIGVLLITTNRGLVGGFNSNLMNKLKEIDSNTELLSELIVMGRKGTESAARSNRELIAQFPKHDSTEQAKDVYPIIKLLTDAYATGEYTKIVVVYNHFVSTLVQQPTAKTLLPFELEIPAGDVDGEAGGRGTRSATTKAQPSNSDIIFEPTKEGVLNHLLPRIMESQVYQAILESDASEHSARMVMMKNATEAAGDLIDDLTLTFNQLRQNKITTELSEITAGRIALE